MKQVTITTTQSSRFWNKDGQISEYSLMCGYVQRSGDKDMEGQYLDLYLEHGTYHVKGLGQWESFYLLTEARKYFMRLTKDNNLTLNTNN